jgi:hypothetical protein
VREFARDELNAAEIYFDRYCRAEDNAAFERAVEECAYLVWQLDARGFELIFRSQESELDDLFATLGFLALAQPVTVPADPPATSIVIRAERG